MELLAHLASIFGPKIAEKIMKELSKGRGLEQVTIDEFMTRSQRRKADLLLAVERGEMILKGKK